MPDDLLDKFAYTLGEIIASDDIHPNGSLIKYADSPAIYLVENGRKRQFNSWDIFVTNGYVGRPVFIIPNTEVYETAKVIHYVAESLTIPVVAALFRE